MCVSGGWETLKKCDGNNFHRRLPFWDDENRCGADGPKDQEREILWVGGFARSTPLVGNFLCMGFSGGVGELNCV
jgi:hypothetical protein